MLNIKLFTFNPFQENTYIITDEHKQCWIVDPGMYGNVEETQLLSYIEKNGLKPVSIINTHAHIDHILGVNALVNKYSVPFGIHESEVPVLNFAAGSASMFGLNLPQIPKPDFYIKENAPLKLGDHNLEIRHVPGHSPGSIIFYYEPGNWAITGDALFKGSIGRTDLPGGNFKILIESIQTQLFTLPGQTKIYPGHGPYTTITDEVNDNPFFQQ